LAISLRVVGNKHCNRLTNLTVKTMEAGWRVVNDDGLISVRFVAACRQLENIRGLMEFDLLFNWPRGQSNSFMEPKTGHEWTDEDRRLWLVSVAKDVRSVVTGT
jgi:hypothetical protein